MSEAVKRELSQVESIIKDVSPTNCKAEQSTVENSYQTRAVEATASFTAVQCPQDGSSNHNNYVL